MQAHVTQPSSWRLVATYLEGFVSWPNIDETAPVYKLQTGRDTRHLMIMSKKASVTSFAFSFGFRVSSLSFSRAFGMSFKCKEGQKMDFRCVRTLQSFDMQLTSTQNNCKVARHLVRSSDGGASCRKGFIQPWRGYLRGSSYLITL